MSGHLAELAAILASQTPTEAPGGGCLDPNLMLPLILVAILYFVWMRPASKERRKHQEMLDALKRGDEVITNSGMIGTIADMSEKIITLEVAKGVKIRVLRSAVARNAAELKPKEPEAEKAPKASK